MAAMYVPTKRGPVAVEMRVDPVSLAGCGDELLCKNNMVHMFFPKHCFDRKIPTRGRKNPRGKWQKHVLVLIGKDPSRTCADLIGLLIDTNKFTGPHQAAHVVWHMINNDMLEAS